MHTLLGRVANVHMLLRIQGGLLSFMETSGVKCLAQSSGPTVQDPIILSSSHPLITINKFRSGAVSILLQGVLCAVTPLLTSFHYYSLSLLLLISTTLWMRHYHDVCDNEGKHNPSVCSSVLFLFTAALCRRETLECARRGR
jgi:hypothetical protein